MEMEKVSWDTCFSALIQPLSINDALYIACKDMAVHEEFDNVIVKYISLCREVICTLFH